MEKMEQYGLSGYLAIKQKYFDQYQASLQSGSQSELTAEEEQSMSAELQKAHAYKTEEISSFLYGK